MREYYLSKNKYIRLRVIKYYAYFRADISVNKYCFNDNVPSRYYEINFDCFHPCDYSDENEALTNAIEWLKKEAIKFQEQLKEVTNDKIHRK